MIRPLIQNQHALPLAAGFSTDAPLPLAGISIGQILTLKFRGTDKSVGGSSLHYNRLVWE